MRSPGSVCLFGGEGPRSERDLIGCETVQQIGWCRLVVGDLEPERAGEHGDYTTRGVANGEPIIEGDRPVAFGQTITIGGENQRNVGPCRPGDAEHVGEVGVTRSRRQEVVGPHDLFDTLRVVIDDHDKVVGGCAVAASKHDIVDDLSVLAVQTIDDGYRWLFGPQADGRRFARRLPLGDLCRREIATCAGVVAGRQVGCRHRLTDLSARAPAPVGQPGGAQIGERVLVAFHPLGLPDRFAVPIKAETFEISTLSVLVLASSGRRIEILEPQKELALGAAGEQPGGKRRSQVPDVEDARGARGETTSTHPPSVARTSADRAHRSRLMCVAAPFHLTIAL